jgi:hypothetical protein
VDPDFETTLEAYLYAGDDPVNGLDPDGLDHITSAELTCQEKGMAACLKAYEATYGRSGLIGALLTHAAKDLGKVVRFARRHERMIEAIATTAIAVAAAGSGVGALVDLGLGATEAADTWAAASDVFTAVNGVIDTGRCVGAHDKNACVAAAFDLAAGSFGAGGRLAEKAGAQVLANLLRAKAVSAGAGSVAWDASSMLLRQ